MTTTFNYTEQLFNKCHNDRHKRSFSFHFSLQDGDKERIRKLEAQVRLLKYVCQTHFLLENQISVLETFSWKRLDSIRQINFSNRSIEFYILFISYQVFQLRNIITKLTGQDGSGDGSKKKKRNDRPFDFKLYKRRHVLLQVQFFIWL